MGTCASTEKQDDAAGEDLQVVQVIEEVKRVPIPRIWILPEGRKLTVMMFGMTGAGKSSLGNLIADTAHFAAGDDTSSITNLDSIMKYEAEDSSLTVLDTIGLGDTEINQEKVVASIRDVALSAPNGVDMLMYVMRNARITDDAIARLIYVTEYLWGDESLMNLYIVVTCAARYANSKKEAHDWIMRQVEINWRFKHIFTLVGKNPNRFIFIDNPDLDSGEPEVEERRENSYNTVFKTFCKHPKDAVAPFTQASMKHVQEATKDERKALDEKRQEVTRIKNEIAKTQPVKKGKKGKAVQEVEEVAPAKSAEDAKLDQYLQKAKADMILAHQAMANKLEL
ncbi:unnamed protein product, partial [Polarella glacialis]